MTNNTGFDPTRPATWPELLTTGEVARVFRVSARTVIRWAEQKQIRASRTLGVTSGAPGHRRYYREDVVAIVRGGEEQQR